MSDTRLLNVSSSPHVRSHHSTHDVMMDVILALMPATFWGIWHFGLHAALILACSVLSAVASEAAFCYFAKKPCSVRDCSAVMTGLMLGLCLSPMVPLYVPILGSMFAIIIVKCAFGGLGHNFMNPALAGRCFLLISFGSVMTNYGMDGITGATPLAVIANGGSVDIMDMFLGNTAGCIGLSCAALLLGGIYLLICGDIAWEIPAGFIGSFLVIMAAFGGHGLDFGFLVAEVCGGGFLLGALFMSTDPVTSPFLPSGQLLYGILAGGLTALFRVRGSATDSISYAIILSNLVVPLINRLPVPAPFGAGVTSRELQPKVPKGVIVLTVITLIAGAALGGTYYLTKDAIHEQELAASAAAYAEVVPEAEQFGHNSEVDNYIKEYCTAVYGSGSYGKAYIREAVEGKDASGSIVGYAVSVTTSDGFEGNITLSVGFDADGTIQGIAFTELNETAGMGMRVAEDAWRGQFVGSNVDTYTLIKTGKASAPGEIDTVSGASTTSGAVVNAVNAAVDFFNHHLK